MLRMAWPFSRSRSAKRTTKKGKAKPARGGKTAGSKPGAKGQPGDRPWNPARTMQGVKWLLAVAAIVGVAFAWQQGKAALERSIARATPDELSVEHVELADPPPWMTDAGRDRIRAVVAKWAKPDPFESRSLTIAAEALRADPVVKRVEQVRRTPGGGVVVEAAYRTPAAVVETAGGYRLVDDETVVLPWVYERHHVAALAQRGLVVLLGVSTRPPAEAGHVWEGAGLRAGLKLASVIRAEPFASEVKAIDVGHRRGDAVELYLVTDDGPVRWGLPPGEERTVEPDTELKLKRLRHLAATRGTIALPGRVVEINGPRAASVEIRLLPEEDRPRAAPAF